MKSYVIVEITIHDQELYDEYKKLTPATIAAYDGKFIVRGGKTESLEGNWNPQRLVSWNSLLLIVQKNGGVRKDIQKPKR